jgi:hypothetical protein
MGPTNPIKKTCMKSLQDTWLGEIVKESIWDLQILLKKHV